MAFDSVASAVDWLDTYRARSSELLNLYSEDAADLLRLRRRYAPVGTRGAARATG